MWVVKEALVKLVLVSAPLDITAKYMDSQGNVGLMLPSLSGKLYPHLAPHHVMVCPANGTPHHPHIRTQLALLSAHQDIVYHVRLLCSWMFPCHKMHGLLGEPSVHDGEVVGSTELE
jgi:hypothetical protein